MEMSFTIRVNTKYDIGETILYKDYNSYSIGIITDIKSKQKGKSIELQYKVVPTRYKNQEKMINLITEADILCSAKDKPILNDIQVIRRYPVFKDRLEEYPENKLDKSLKEYEDMSITQIFATDVVTRANYIIFSNSNNFINVNTNERVYLVFEIDYDRDERPTCRKGKKYIHFKRDDDIRLYITSVDTSITGSI